MSKSPITVSLSPNTEADDVWLALKIMLQPWLWNNQEIIARVERQLSRFINHQPVVMTSSGRAALHCLLRAYGIGRGDEVMTQAFTCLAVPASVRQAGAAPVYADTVPRTYNLDPVDVRRKVTGRTRAIIVQHTFGIPGPVDELRRIASRNNLLLLEDCAHGLGAAYKGRKVGTLGDAAFFSFGRDKTLSCVFGGAVSSADGKVIAEAKRIEEGKSSPPLIWTKQQLLHPLLLKAVLPLYFKAGTGKALLVAWQKLGFLSKAVEPREKKGEPARHLDYAFPGGLAYLLSNQLEKLDRYTARRRRAARTYLDALAGRTTALPAPLGNTAPAWLRFPLLVKDPRRLHQAARQQQILLGDWYDSAVAPVDSDQKSLGYRTGSCPRAEEASRHVVNLPTYPRLTDEQLRRVISLVSSY